MGACRRRRARRTRNGSGNEGEQTLEGAVKGKAIDVEKGFEGCVYGCRGAYLIMKLFRWVGPVCICLLFCIFESLAFSRVCFGIDVWAFARPSGVS